YFLEARPLGPQESRVNVGITGATYLLAVSRKVVQELSTDGSLTPLETAIAGFLRTPSTKVVRRIKGIGKVVDVREYVDELAIDDTHIATLAHAGLVGDLIPIRA